MNKLSPVLSVIGGILVVFGIIAFTGVYDGENNGTQNVSELTKITEVIPNVVLDGENASWRTTNISSIKNEIDYTIEGTVLEFGSPIETISQENWGHGSIPVTISVEQFHKGNIPVETFTFFIDSLITLNPSEIYEIDNVRDYLDIHRKMYVGQDYANVEKIYQIYEHSSLFEIGDRIIVHIGIKDSENINYIYEADEGKLTPYYSIKLGPYGYYTIEENQAFNKKYKNGIPVAVVMSESLS